MTKFIGRYNYYLLYGFAIAPLIGWLLYHALFITFYKVMIVFSFLGLGLLMINRISGKKIKFPVYLIFYLGFILYEFYSDLIRLERSFEVKFLVENLKIGAFLTLLLIENTTITRKRYRQLIAASKYVLIVAILVLLVQEVSDPFFLMRPEAIREGLYTSATEKRLYSIYTWNGGLIFSFGYGFVPIYILLIEHLKKQGKNIFPYVVAGLLLVFLTRQRWVMLNYAMIFFLLVEKRKFVVQSFKYLTLGILSIFLCFQILNFAGINAQKIVEDRILESDKKMSEKTAGTRLLAFKAFDKLFWDQPFFGVGNIKYGLGGRGQEDYKLARILKGHSSQIHVGYLSLLYMYGIVGALLFLIFLFLLLRRLYRDGQKTGFWTPFLAFIGIALNNWVDVNFHTFSMGLIVVLAANNYYLREHYLKSLEIEEAH